MADIDTVKSITTNMEAILTSLGMSLEDGSGNPDADSPLCQILYKGEDFGDLYGEHKEFNDILFLIKIEFNKEYPGISRDKQTKWINNLRKEITINALNVGDISSSELVSFVEHPDGEDSVDYEPPMSEIDYPISVRYGEI